MGRQLLTRIVACCGLALAAAIATLAPAYAVTADDFVGTWDTYTSVQLNPHFDVTIVKVSATHVTGEYQTKPGDPMGHIEGDVDASGALNFTWSAGLISGTGTFNLTGPNQIFGGWIAIGLPPIMGTWMGTRKFVSSGGGGSLPPPGSVATTSLLSDASVHTAPGKNTPVITALAAGSIVGYEPACPGGYCKIYWSGKSGYVWKQLLAIGSAGGGGLPPPSGGGSGSGGAPATTALLSAFIGNWQLVLTPTGNSPFNYTMQVTPSGAGAKATMNTTVPTTMSCSDAGSVISCTWANGGLNYSGEFTFLGPDIDGTWQDTSGASQTGTWHGVKM